MYAPPPTISSGVCPVCHQAVKSEYFFCPNCGNALHPAPLSTTAAAQAWIYSMSIVLPMILFIGITHWPGYKYFKSDDPAAKQIGIVAIVLLVLSTVVTFWLAYVTTMNAVKSSISSINADMSI